MSEQQSTSGTLRIGYILKMFPRLSETFILNEMLELERRGCEIVIFSLKKPVEGRFHPQLSKLQAKVFYLEDLDPKKWQHWLAPEWESLGTAQSTLWSLMTEALEKKDTERTDYLWWSAWIASKVKQLGLQRLHAHFASLPSTIAHFTSLLARVPYSFTAHAKDIFVYSLEEHYLGTKLRQADFVVTVTEFNKRYLMEKDPAINPERIKVIHNGIDLYRFAPVDFSTRTPGLILSVGRLVAKKGFVTLLEACALLRSHGAQFRCVIAGEGPDRAMLKQKSAELGLGNEVDFVGPVHTDQVLQLLQQSSMFCLPCTVDEDNNMDALPTVLLESLATGVPSISTTVSGIPEIITHEEDGILVPPDNALALSEQMSRLLSSPQLAQDLGAKGRKKAEAKFDLQKNVEQLLKLYQGETTGASAVSEQLAGSSRS